MGSNNQIVRGGLGLADPIYRPTNGSIFVYTAKTAALIHRLCGGKMVYLVPFLLDVAGYITAPNGVRCTPYRVFRGGRRVVFPELPKTVWGNARISIPVNPRSGSVISTHPIFVEQERNYYAVSAQELPLLLEGRKLALETVKIYLGATTAETTDHRFHVEATEGWKYEVLQPVVQARFPYPRALLAREDEMLPRSEYAGALRRKLGVFLRSVTRGRSGLLSQTAEDAKIYAEMSRLPESEAVTLADKKLKMGLVRTQSGAFFARADFATDLPGEPFVVAIQLDATIAHRALSGSRVELAEIREGLEAKARDTFTERFRQLYPDAVLH